MNDWIVFGLGRSVKFISRTAALAVNTIGVNDIDKFHTVDHLIIPDPWTRFTEARIKTISNTKAKTLWLQEKRSWPGLENHPDIRYFTCILWDKLRPFPLEEDALPAHFTSPFIASALAWKLGAKRIGILGMDCLPGHQMNNHLPVLLKGFEELRNALLQRGTELVNLSPISVINTLPLKSLSFIRSLGK
jgi:hypothetical protein